jgi:hypothetical protein
MLPSYLSSESRGQNRFNSHQERESYHARSLAMGVNLFSRARTRASWHRFWSDLTHKRNELLSLASVEHTLGGHAMHYGGIQQIRLRWIVGTEGRLEDFDDQFNPRHNRLKARWASIAMAWYQGIGLPALSLLQIGDYYFVRDGHHRVSVALAFGCEFYDAEVTMWDAPDLTSFFILLGNNTI